MAAGEDVLKLIANPLNQRILNLLATEPSFPRAMAKGLGMGEAEVARRLAALERAGIVEGRWTREGRNVKLYKLCADRVSLSFDTTGMRVQVEARGQPREATISAFHFGIPENAFFIGRERELERLRGARMAVVTGLAGMGKTALLVEFARRLDRPVYWHSCSPVDTRQRFLARLGVFLEQRGRAALRQAVDAGALPDPGLVVREADDADLVVVVDDYHELRDPASREMVRAFLDQAQRCTFVMSSRERPDYLPPGRGILEVELSGLSEGETRSFLAAKGLDVGPEGARKVWQRFAGNPLMLNLYAEAAKAAQEMAPSTDPRGDEFLWAQVYSRLQEDERELLEAASVFRRGFTPDALQMVAGGKRVEPLLYSLGRKLLLGRSGDAYALHELIREFSYQKLRNKKQAHQRAAQWYEHQGGVEARLESMHHWLMAAEKKRAALLLEERNLDLAEFDVMRDGYDTLYLDVLDQFTERDVDPALWASILDERGDIHFKRGQHEEAMEIYGAALEVKGAAADRAADLRWKRSLLLEKLGRKAEALAEARDGLEAADKKGLARARLQEQVRKLAPAKPRAPAKRRR